MYGLCPLALTMQKNMKPAFWGGQTKIVNILPSYE